MKFYLFYLAVFVSGFSFSQMTNMSGVGGSIDTFAELRGVEFDKVANPTKNNRIEGSVHVFETWDNNGVIKLGSQNYSIKNINFNAFKNTIESKIDEESVYAFDLKTNDVVYINNREFRNCFDPKKGMNRIFEVIAGDKDFQLLKSYDIQVYMYQADPLMIRKKDGKYMTNKAYHINSNGNISEVKLKKKSLLKAFGDKSKAIEKFIKSNKLSYKKEDDLKKIIDHFNSL